MHCIIDAGSVQAIVNHVDG